jgi:hypothetical protein
VVTASATKAIFPLMAAFLLSPDARHGSNVGPLGRGARGASADRSGDLIPFRLRLFARGQPIIGCSDPWPYRLSVHTGEVAEWLKASAFRCAIRATVSGVRILPLSAITSRARPSPVKGS